MNKKIYLSALVKLDNKLQLNLITIQTYIKISSFIHSRILLIKINNWK
jgi:hypothetical protein